MTNLAMTTGAAPPEHDGTTTTGRFACVAVNVPVRAQRAGVEGEATQTATFHYHIPPGLDVRPGHLVWVPFGARQVQGVVTALSDTTPVADTKPIQSLCDERPYLSGLQLRLAQWMADYYLCPLSDCVFALLPPGIEQRMQVHVEAASAPPPDAVAGLTAEQRRVWDLLQRRPHLSVDSIRAATRLRNAAALVDQLERRGLVVKRRVIPGPRVRPRIVRSVALAADEGMVRAEIERVHEPRLRRARVLRALRAAGHALEVAELVALANSTRQAVRDLAREGLVAIGDDGRRAALAAGAEQVEDAIAAYATPPVTGRAGALALLLAQAEPIEAIELCKATKCSSAQLASLVEGGFVRIEEHEERRDPLAHRTFTPARTPELTHDQQQAYAAIAAELRLAASNGTPPRPVLLHGVTGSGKTEIYLRALADTLAMGRQAIIMVPEIALTPQTIQRFAARFPGRIAVLHSALSLGERYDEWRRMRDGLVDIAVGSRSAVFAPLPRLGLIVLDEEHEWTYKQSDMPPRYHARSVAIRLAELTGALVIMGSATPDVATYQSALDGQYTLLSLRQRVTPSAPPAAQAVSVSPSSLPPVELVDLRQELREGNRSIFSRALHSALATTLAAGQQAILFLNRRGSATFVMCRDCGHVLRCRSCDAPLGYHQPEADLVCHQCNRRTAMPERCPSCWSRRIRFFGVGTQKVEDEVQRLFPAARTLRWDRDVTQGKLAHEQILARFVRHEADVLIGTQMIAKGLDLPLVTLVGVISADTALHLPDFRAGERTFQLLTQVAGRAGRSALGGRVIVQTYTPEHYAVQAASHHNYAAFAAHELAFRAARGYPPFAALARLVLQEPNEDRAQHEAERVRDVLALRIAQQGLAETTLAGPAPCFVSRLRGRYRWQILVLARDVHPLLAGLTLPAGWAIDVDPVSTL